MANNNKQNILVEKASGEMEPFSQVKLRRSLERVNATPKNIEEIISHILRELKSGARTRDIYRHAFSLLRRYERPAAGRYSIKQAIMELGPTGYPFEKLVGELLKSEGFLVETNIMVQGLCVAHEVDVVAQQDNRHIMIECKFHNQPGNKSDVKVALYIQARFEDVQKAWQKKPGHAQKFHEAWLVTNTKLTSDAIRYAQCIGMKAIGWNYPPQEGLEVRIDRTGLHPITCLTTLSAFTKRQLLDKGVVLCKEVLEDGQILQALGLNDAKIAQVKQEVNELCQTR